jgi:polyphosphate kinase 2 (PPK2 family)
MEQVDKFLESVPMMERAMVESGIILLKYWLEVTPQEQERRLRDRVNDGRKTGSYPHGYQILRPLG